MPASIQTDGARRARADVLATVSEAAFVSGASRHTVNQAIDRGEIRTRRPREAGASGRRVGMAEIIYLRVQDLLSTRGRKIAYKKLMRVVVDLDAEPPMIELENGVRLDITAPVAEALARLDELGRIRSRVEVDPGIRGGEPVFRGTRIPVHMIAGFVRKGVPAEELLEDYPSLTAESLQVATRYAELYPRRGRPRQAPWRAHEPAHVLEPEDLRG
jgi:uncharacterized protein (DUF433 family)